MQLCTHAADASLLKQSQLALPTALHEAEQLLAHSTTYIKASRLTTHLIKRCANHIIDSRGTMRGSEEGPSFSSLTSVFTATSCRNLGFFVASSCGALLRGATSGDRGLFCDGSCGVRPRLRPQPFLGEPLYIYLIYNQIAMTTQYIYTTTTWYVKKHHHTPNILMYK